MLVAGAGLLVAACGTSTTADAPTAPVFEPSAVAGTTTVTPSPTLRPGQLETLALDALSPAAADLARGLGNRIGIGIAVYVPSERRIYQYNAEPLFGIASVVKAPIMLTVMDRAIDEGRSLTADESALVQAMIVESDNDATTALWNLLGGALAVQEFLESNGIHGALIDAKDWGDSKMSAESAARLLGKLLNGEILDAPNRALAMQLMSHVDPVQDWGAVVAGEFEGQTGVKNGWYPEPAGWVLGSVGYVVPDGAGPIYTVAIFTNGWLYFNEGVHALEAVAGLISTAFTSE
jgi:beta-lactamase class A